MKIDVIRRPDQEFVKSQFHKLAEYELSGLSPDEVLSVVNSSKGLLKLELIQTKSELAKVTAERDAIIYALKLYTEACLTCSSKGCDTCGHVFSSAEEINWEFDIARFTRERERHGRV